MELLQSPEIAANTLRIPYPYTSEDARSWLQFASQLPEKGLRQLAIRQRGGDIVGAIGLEDSPDVARHRAEIGYWLGRDYWGRGIMKRAVERLCRYACDDLGIGKITAHVFSTNHRSAAVLRTVGFQLEAQLPLHYLKNDQYIDADIYSLVSARLAAQRAANG